MDMSSHDKAKTKKRKNKFKLDVTPAYVAIEENNLLRDFGDELPDEDDEDFNEDNVSQPATKKNKKNDGCRTGTTGSASASQIPTENQESVDKPYQKKERKKKSEVWRYLDTVKVDGKEFAQCKFCSTRLLLNDTKSTSSFRRHLDKCLPKHGHSRQAHLQLKQGSNSEVNISQFKYDHALMREKMSHYIMACELSFVHVEHFMFNELMRTATPFWQKITRGTLKSDCITTYELEKKKLKEKFSVVKKINLTTDMWTALNQKIGYMVITGHWIDDEWKLNSRILNFCNVPPPHSGDVISEAIFKCLVEWGIEDKIGTITVDNAKANDVAIRNLRDSFSIRRPLPLGGKLFHVRCCAHILNLCVKDGLEPIEPIVDKIRGGIKYIAISEGRTLKFGEIANQLQLKQKKLILDVPTRWNSTYAMLDSSIGLKQVFPRYARADAGFLNFVPQPEDWERVENVCKLLVVFSDATKVVSGSEYPTTNLFLSEIKRVKEVIDKKVFDENDYINKMAQAMREKFEKYWGECNLVMSIGAVMDPRFKMALPKYTFSTLYPLPGEAVKKLKYLRDVLGDIYQFYVSEDSKIKGMEMEETGQLLSLDQNPEFCETLAGVSEFETFMMSTSTNMEPIKSELDDYLSEKLLIVSESLHKNFDVISWWKANSPKYPILSQMARDVLAIPISTVASEASFSAGGRVIEPYRSCLKPETVQILLCGADWVRALYGLKSSSQVTFLFLCTSST